MMVLPTFPGPRGEAGTAAGPGAGWSVTPDAPDTAVERVTQALDAVGTESARDLREVAADATAAMPTPTVEKAAGCSLTRRRSVLRRFT